MAVGPIRGGVRPPVPAVQEKPQGADAQPKKVLEKALDGVLKPGQHLVLPARTGLAHFKDHFDARTRPEYDKLLKGETRASESKATAAEAPVDDAAATSLAAESALSMMDLLPPVVVPQQAIAVRQSNLAEAEETEEAEERRRGREQPEDEEWVTDPGEEDPDPEFAPPPQVELESRLVELQAGLFTLEEGSVDVGSRRLCTLEAHLDGDVPYVTVAVDLQAIPEGASLRIPALEAAFGRPVTLRALHQNARTEGVGTAYLEVCVSEPTEELRSVLEKIVSVEIGGAKP